MTYTLRKGSIADIMIRTGAALHLELLYQERWRSCIFDALCFHPKGNHHDSTTWPACVYFHGEYSIIPIGSSDT